MVMPRKDGSTLVCCDGSQLTPSFFLHTLFYFTTSRGLNVRHHTC